MRAFSAALISILLMSLSALAAPTSLSFNGNLAGAASITSLVLTITSGGCNLFATNDYGSVTLSGNGDFSVTIDGASGTYLGNPGAGYTNLAQIFNADNTNILGQSSCSVNGTSATWSVLVTVNGVTLSGAVPVNAVPFAVHAATATNAQKISGMTVSPLAPTSNQILQFVGGIWTPMSPAASGTVNSVTASPPLISTGGTDPEISLAGLAGLGAANQILGMNSSGTGYEYKTVANGAGISITHGPNSLTMNVSSELAGVNALSTLGFVKRTGAGTYSTGSADLASEVTGILPVQSGGTNSSAILSNNRIMISSGGSITESPSIGASAPMRTNAAGLPTTGAIALATEVSGTLPLANGGTNSTTGSITGTSALTFAAGGSNQNITLSPSGSGALLTSAKVGIGVTAPQGHLSIYQAANTSTDLNIGVLGTGNSETANINFITKGGTQSFGMASTKGFQLTATGASHAYPGFFDLTYYDGVATPLTLFSIGSGYGSMGVPFKFQHYIDQAYAPTSGVLAKPDGQSVEISNIAGTAGRSAFSIFSPGSSQSSYIGAVATASGNTPNIVFGQQTGATAYNERMRIDSAGLVGIGTAIPSTRLDVAGAIRGRVIYPDCSAGCTIFNLSPGNANAIRVKSTSGAVTMGTAHVATFANLEGTEFSFSVCATGASPITVTFGGATYGFVSGASWPTVPSGTCTSQKFVIMNASPGVYLAHPLAPYTNYSM